MTEYSTVCRKQLMSEQLISCLGKKTLQTSESFFTPKKVDSSFCFFSKEVISFACEQFNLTALMAHSQAATATSKQQVMCQDFHNTVYNTDS